MVEEINESILLKPEDFVPSSCEFKILGVLNPGAARLKDGRIVLYVRIIEQLINSRDKEHFYSPRFIGEDSFSVKIDKFKKGIVKNSSDFDFSFKNGTKRLTYLSHLRRVILDKDGLQVLKIEQKPSFFGLIWDSELGVEDPRITKIGDTYCMTYVGLSRKENISTSLALSKDGFRWFRRGIIFGEQDKDCVLFPGKIGGKYVIFDRPEGNFEFTSPHMWVAYSKDLEYWGKLKAVSFLEKDSVFARSGAGPPPIKTKKGWLLIFHAVKENHKKVLVRDCQGNNELRDKKFYSYDAWAALFDLKIPSKLIGISSKPVLSPVGDSSKSFEGKCVIFPTGLVENGKKELLIYSGVGDRFVGVNKVYFDEILNSIEKAG